MIIEGGLDKVGNSKRYMRQAPNEKKSDADWLRDTSEYKGNKNTRSCMYTY
jgi:hypothetical protein